MVDLASKMLLDDRSRFVSTIAGGGFSVMMVTIQVGIFLGMLDNASITITRTDADLWVAARGTPNVDFGNTFPEVYVHRVRSIPGVARADNLIVWFVTVALPNGAKESALIYAVEDFTRWKLPWEVLEGNPADLRRGPYALLDESARKRFGQFSVGAYREILGRRFKIIGITRGARSFTTNPIAFIDYRQAQALYPAELQGRTTYILVKLAEGASPAEVRAEIRRRLPFNDVHSRTDWAERCRAYWVESTGLGLSVFMMVFLGALVGVVIVGQTLYASTMDHRREFATIKAIGGTNADVYRIISKQSLIVALASFAVGMVLARVVSPFMEMQDLKIIIPPTCDLIVLIGTVVLCLAASLVSFRRIASLDPAVVFRD